MARNPLLDKHLAEKAIAVPGVVVAAFSTSEYPLLIVTALAVAVPLMWAYQQPPLPAFYSQSMACALWALVLLVAVWSLRPTLRPSNSRALFADNAPNIALWAVLLALVAAHNVTGLSPLVVAGPIAFNLLLAGLLSVVMPVYRQHEAARQRWIEAFLAGVLVAALFNSLVGGLQAFAPEWTNDIWIASREVPHDRIAGNLRQPNQLATLMVWGLLSATYLLRSIPLLWIAACAPLTATLFATGSRTGVIGLFLIIVIALLRSSRVRAWRKGTWILLAIAIIPLAWMAEAPFSRTTAAAAMSQRLALWRDVIELIRQQPWTGVGIGQLNFAWTLTPLAARAPDVFDHAHNLPLHLAAELGVPAALFIFTLLATIAWCARAAMRTRPGATVALLLLIMLVHSLLEYPLWFSYFLLPSAFLLAWLASPAGGETVGVRALPDATHETGNRGLPTWFPLTVSVAAVSLLTALVYATHEYGKAVSIHRRVASPAALSTAVDVAGASPLFGQFGDYAAIMLAGDKAPLALFERPIRYVLDERLLVAYARALARAGDYERAAFVTARAREFPPNPLLDGLPVIAAPSVTAASATRLGPRDFRR